MEIINALITHIEALAGENAHLHRRLAHYQALSSNEPKPRKRAARDRRDAA
jgi:hypothetical protein